MGADYQLKIPATWHLIQARVENPGSTFGQVQEEFITPIELNNEIGSTHHYKTVTCAGTTGLRGNGAEYMRYRQDASGRVHEYCVKVRETGFGPRSDRHKFDRAFANNHLALATDGQGTLINGVNGVFGPVIAERRVLVNYFKDGFDKYENISHFDARCSQSPLSWMDHKNWELLEGHFQALSFFPEIVRVRSCNLISTSPTIGHNGTLHTILVSYETKKPGSNEIIEVNWEITPQTSLNAHPFNYLPVMQADIRSIILELPGRSLFNPTTLGGF